MTNKSLIIDTTGVDWSQFHSDPVVAKYRDKLGRLVATRILCAKSDRSLIQPQIDRLHVQIRGRMITLLKASKMPMP